MELQEGGRKARISGMDMKFHAMKISFKEDDGPASPAVAVKATPRPAKLHEQDPDARKARLSYRLPRSVSPPSASCRP